jgi:hypothetical protein
VQPGDTGADDEETRAVGVHAVQNSCGNGVLEERATTLP